MSLSITENASKTLYFPLKGTRGNRKFRQTECHLRWSDVERLILVRLTARSALN